MSGTQGHVSGWTVAREWGRIGVLGFGGPPTHIAMLRDLCVAKRGWIGETDFEKSIAVCNLLPGPASTQLAILTARKVAGVRGAVVGGLAFILPGFGLIVALSTLFLLDAPPTWVLGLGSGAGAAIAAVAISAGLALARPSRQVASSRIRWFAYVALGGLAAVFAGPYVVVVLIGCGLCEVGTNATDKLAAASLPMLGLSMATTGGLSALAFVAIKVGALSYGGGFVIVPMMQHDAVSVHHWMTDGQFLNAVALGQVTPGPVVLTIAVVGFAARGIVGAALATVVAFGPSFLFVLVGWPYFEKFRSAGRPASFLRGAGPAAIGAILGAAIPLAGALSETWQLGILAGAIVWAVILKKSAVVAIVASGVCGLIAVVVGAPLP